MIIFKFKTGSGHSLNSSIHFFGKGELARPISITVFFEQVSNNPKFIFSPKTISNSGQVSNPRPILYIVLI